MKVVYGMAAGLVLASLHVPYAGAQTSQEQAVLARLTTLRASNSDSTTAGSWIQPSNRAEKCEVYMWGVVQPIKTLKWLGDCQKGRASGLGLIVNESAQGKSVTLEEYGSKSAEVISYRQVQIAPELAIVRGRMTPEMTAFEVISVGSSPKGNVTVVSGNQYCQGGECLGLMVDPLTGSVTRRLNGSNYMIDWLEQRAENEPLFTRRALMMDGAVPVEKYVLDGGVYDFYRDLRSGQVLRVTFADEINGVLALPMERSASVQGEIDAAVSEANSKFANVYERFCKAQKDPDIRAFCDPTPLIPSDTMLRDARAELNEMGRAAYVQNQKSASLNAQAAQATQAQAQQMQALAAEQGRQAQAYAAEQQRQASQEALRRGLESINQAGQAAQRAGQQQLRQSYGTPQVQTPSLHQTGIVHCRTIGYVTTCN